MVDAVLPNPVIESLAVAALGIVPAKHSNHRCLSSPRVSLVNRMPVSRTAFVWGFVSWAVSASVFRHVPLWFSHFDDQLKA